MRSIIGKTKIIFHRKDEEKPKAMRQDEQDRQDGLDQPFAPIDRKRSFLVIAVEKPTVRRLRGFQNLWIALSLTLLAKTDMQSSLAKPATTSETAT
jgi:hypothetical protein